MKQNVFLRNELAWHDHKSLRLTDEATEDEEVRMHRYVLLRGAPSSLEMFGMVGPASKQKMVCTFLLRVYLKLLVGLVDRLQCG